MTTDPIPSTNLPTPTYADDDLVYVDPDTRTVVKKVEWTQGGKAVKLERKAKEQATDTAKPGRPPRKFIQRTLYYPWGTYRTMKKIYKIEGKVQEIRGNVSLDEVLPKALKEPFWNA